MDILPLLDRCVDIERAASEVYDTLAGRWADDAELHALWCQMAKEERAHAQTLATWRALIEAGPSEHRMTADGFADGVTRLERLLASTREAATRVTTADEAFALALALETSEIDAIYTILLQSSPLARSPDAIETTRQATAEHHQRLIRTVKRRSSDEQNLLRAGLLAAQHLIGTRHGLSRLR